MSDVQQLLDARQEVLVKHREAYREWRWNPSMTNAIARDLARQHVALFGANALISMKSTERGIDKEYEARKETL